jgi:hypothetical protein
LDNLKNPFILARPLGIHWVQEGHVLLGEKSQKDDTKKEKNLKKNKKQIL